ncbi:hypothetical protein PUN28_003111 [Cardiocondyla obscurior]|uniref:Uncharacterized protein n=1 Tax=Cardiocondyla obscurior TaxID=286306 RepID=A0AAW2GK16_9HYME
MQQCAKNVFKKKKKKKKNLESRPGNVTGISYIAAFSLSRYSTSFECNVIAARRRRERDRQNSCIYPAKFLWSRTRCIANLQYYIRSANNDLSYRARARICIRYRRMDDGRVILPARGTRAAVGRYQTSESNKFCYSNRIRVP